MPRRKLSFLGQVPVNPVSLEQNVLLSKLTQLPTLRSAMEDFSLVTGVEAGRTGQRCCFTTTVTTTTITTTILICIYLFLLPKVLEITTCST